MVKIQPAIKWTGSKRKQSEIIVSKMPKKIKTYYEPFVGSASVMFQLLHSDIEVESIVCSDINNDLIELWKEIKSNYTNITEGYRKHYDTIYNLSDVEDQKKYYKDIRNKFNVERNPVDFMFLIRLATNGLIRYNNKGEFNSSIGLNKKQKGIEPNKLERILEYWSLKLEEYNVKFKTMSYSEINTEEGDFVYLDPPYFNTKGMYYGKIDYENFIEWLGNQKGNYALSFDGIRGNEDYTYDLSKELYNEHIYLDNGDSSFKKVKNEGLVNVKESLYVKRND